jgi:serine/threonine-protein kinase
VAYLCDGTQVEAWLRGRAQDGVVTLSGKSGNALTGRLSGHTVSGEIRVQGRRLPFSAQLTAPPGGLYTATVAAALALVTWIVRADGGQTGLQLTDGRAAPAPRLDPTNRLATVAGTTVEAAAVAGDLPPPS